MHSRTTAPEILAAFEGERLDYWVTGYGTGGTLKGVARVLKAERPETRSIVCEPDNSPILGSGIAQAARRRRQPGGSHPVFRPHLMQGWSPGLHPEAHRGRDAMPAGRPDRADQRRRRAAAARASWRGGRASSSASPPARRWPARWRSRDDAPAGASVLCMLPDTGERYLSTPLFEGIAAEMTDEELEISRSTPRLPLRRPAPPPRRRPRRAASSRRPEAARLVRRRARSPIPTQPVVLFALEWCEFCWSVRKLFARLGIPYRSVDLDSVASSRATCGGEIRAVLRRAPAADDPAGLRRRRARRRLHRDVRRSCRRPPAAPARPSRRRVRRDADGRPDELLPKWLHPREVHHARG